MQDDQKTVLLKVLLNKYVQLKYFWSQFKNVHLQGPCSLRPCILYYQNNKPVLPIVFTILATATGNCPKLLFFEIGEFIQFFAGIVVGTFSYQIECLVTKSHQRCVIFSFVSKYKTS